jgi:hypothetical protein
MGRSFGLKGECHQKVNIEDVISAIDRGSLCIVSVTRAFLGGKSIEEIIHALKSKGLHITSETKAYLDENME